MSAPGSRTIRAAVTGLLVLAGISGLFLGCELLVDTSDIDAGCGPGTHYCPGAGCVSLDDPAFGCGDPSCGSCFLNATNTIVSCNEGACEYTCTRGFGCASCDTFILTDSQHCGGCEDSVCATGELCCNGKCSAPPCPQ